MLNRNTLLWDDGSEGGKQQMAGNGSLSAKQERALVALLSEPTIPAAAKAARVGARTLFTWMKHPHFATAYRAARREAVARAIGAVQQAAGDAVKALTDIMSEVTAPAPARVSAAKSILDLAVKAVEIEDFEHRIAALEESARANSPSAHREA